MDILDLLQQRPQSDEEWGGYLTAWVENYAAGIVTLDALLSRMRKASYTLGTDKVLSLIEGDAEFVPFLAWDEAKRLFIRMDTSDIQQNTWDGIDEDG